MKFALASLIAVVMLLSPYFVKGQEVFTLSEITVKDNEIETHSNRALILTGNITVMNQSQLFILGTKIQFSVRGERGYHMLSHNQGRILLTNSTIETLSRDSVVRLSDRSNMTMINANLTGFSSFVASGNSSLKVQNSILNIGYIDSGGDTTSITGASMRKGNMTIHSRSARVERFKGDRLFVAANRSNLMRVECNLLDARSTDPIYLNRSNVKTCTIQSKTNVVVGDSSFGSLRFNSSGVAVNVSTAGLKGRAGGPIQAGNNTTIRRYWYLTVNVTDYTGIGIPARVIVEDYYGNTIATGNAPAEGLYKRTLLAEIINLTKTEFVGNYRIKAEYFNFTTRTIPLVLDSNRYVKLEFAGRVPLNTTTVISVSPETVRVDDPVKIKGWINPGEAGQHIEIVAVGPKNKIGLVTRTDEKGVFDAEFKPDAEGKWTVYADWIGGQSYAAGRFTKSQAIVMKVEPRPSIFFLLIRVLPIAIVVIGVFATIAFLILSRSRESRI